MPELPDIDLYTGKIDERVGKHIARGLESYLWLVLHLMVDGWPDLL